MAIYALYQQDFETLTTATENPDGWTSNRSIAPTVTYFPGGTLQSGDKALGANLENDAPIGNMTVLLSKTLTTVTGRTYTIKSRFTNRVSGEVTNIRVGAGATYGTGLNATTGVTVNPTYTFVAAGTSTTIRLSVENSTHVGTLGFWDLVLVQWSDATANTVSAPTLTTVADQTASTPPTFYWTFNDPQKATGDRQSAFQLTLTRAGTPVFDTGKLAQFSNQFTGGQYLAALSEGNHTWQVRTWDLSDAASSYASGTFNVSHTYTSPTIALTSPGQKARNNTIQIYATYAPADPSWADPSAGVSMSVYAPGNPAPLWNVFSGNVGSAITTIDGGTTWVGTVPANWFTNGTYDVSVSSTGSVSGLGAQGGGTVAGALTVIDPPNAPTLNPHNMFYAANSAGISWNYNAGGTSGAQTAFEVWIKVAGGSEVQIASQSSSATSYSIPANTFTAGLEYTYRVVTYGNGGGNATSAWTTVNLAYQNDNPTVTLNPITFFNATAAKTISWVYDGNDVNDPQSKYRVEIKEGTTTVHDTGTVTSAANSYIIPANTLTNGKTYSVTVTVTDTRWNESVIQIGGDVFHPAESVNIGDWEANGYWQNSIGTVVQSSANPRTGSVSLYQSGANVNNTSLKILSRSALGIVSGVPYTFAGFAAHNRGVTNRTSTAYLQVNQTGITLGTAVSADQPSNAPAVVTAYQPASAKFTPSTDDTIILYLVVGTGGGGSSNSRAYWDDLQLTRDAWTETIPTVYNTTPATGSATATFKTNYTPVSPTVTHRTDFIAQNTANFVWTFVDSNTDQADAQTARRVVITRTSDNVVVHDTGKVTTASTTYTLPAATLANGATYRWQVYTWDSFDFMSTPSAPDTFNTAADVTITITSPVDGIVLDTNQVTVNWSVAIFGSDTQSKRQIKVYRTDTGALVSDTGLVTSALTSYAVTGLSSDILYRIEVQIQSTAGVFSNVAQVTVFPDYVNPNEPSSTLSTIGAQVTLVVTNPAATGLRPDVVVNEIWRAPNIGLSAGQFVKIGETGPNGSFTDYLVGANSTYLYQIKAVS